VRRDAPPARCVVTPVSIAAVHTEQIPSQSVEWSA